MIPSKPEIEKKNRYTRGSSFRIFARMLFLCLYFFFSNGFTIDMGSYYTKSAYEGDSKIPIVGLNLYSKRLTPSFVAFKSKSEFDKRNSTCLTDNEIRGLKPVIGEQAQSLLQTKPYAGSGYLQYFIDINDDESRNVAGKLRVAPPNDTRFKLFNLTTTFLHFYSKMILKSKFADSKTTFVIPGDFSTPQINWLTDAAMHARLKNIKTIFDWEAIANMYAQRRPDIIQKRDKKIMFIDVGATSTKAYTIKFDINRGISKFSAKLLSYHITHDAGGAFITDKLSNYIQNLIDHKNTLSYSEKSKIYETAEYAKCKLSILPKLELTIDDISGQDYRINISREELETVSSDQINKIMECVSLEYHKTKPDFIEIIGGSSRLVKFKKDLSDMISPKKYSTSLNADESLALGGEYFNIFHYVKSQMNVSFYGVSMCEYMFCHDLLLGTGTDLGFQDNPEIFYFNITTPLRRGIMTYNWSYYVNKPMNGFTNYFFFKRNPVEFLYAQQCYASSCKNQSATLIVPNYGDFISILEIEEENRQDLEFLTNTLEEKFYFIKQRNDLIGLLDPFQQEHIQQTRKEIENYLYGNSFTKQQTMKYTLEVEQISSILKGTNDYILDKDQLKEEIDRSINLVHKINPQSKAWLNNEIIDAFNEKIIHAQQFYQRISLTTTNDEIIDEYSALNSWCNSLPQMPKLPYHGSFQRFLFAIGNKILDLLSNVFKIEF